MQNSERENNDVILIVMSFVLIICSVICIPLIGLAVQSLLFDDITGFAGLFIWLGAIALLFEASVIGATCFLFWGSSRRNKL